MRLVKLHGLGNDFLVALDPVPELSSFAAALCRRTTGVGADGLILAWGPSCGGDVRMELHNADGGLAEVSGNGLRCLAMAMQGAGRMSGNIVTVETAAGLRRAEIQELQGLGAAIVSVEMGPVEVHELPSLGAGQLTPGDFAFGGFDGWRAWSVDVGNPHLVALAPCLDGADIALIGPVLEHRRHGGQNVEIVAVGDSPARIDLVVWERGVGVTSACGSGSVAAAAALHRSGIVDDVVEVANPGGPVTVSLSGGDRTAVTATLTGPVRMVADVEVDLEWLETAGVGGSLG